MPHPDNALFVNDAPPSPDRRRLAIAAAATVLLCALAAVLLYLPVAGSHLNRLPMVRQSTPYTCGAAALQSILYYYGDEWREDNLAKELKSDPDQGTSPQEIIRLARSRGLTVESMENLGIDDLRRYVSEGHPVMVALQAWGDRPETYGEGWEDGHYAIVIGFDRKNLHFMDPSTLGHYAFIPIPEFLTRWHDYYIDKEGRRINLVHFALVFSGKSTPSYDSDARVLMK